MHNISERQLAKLLGVSQGNINYVYKHPDGLTPYAFKKIMWADNELHKKRRALEKKLALSTLHD